MEMGGRDGEARMRARSRERRERTRTDGWPSHSLPFALGCGFSVNTVSPKYERVGDADMGRMDESSVLARLWVDGVGGKLWSDDKCKDWVHLESMDTSWDCGAGFSWRGGMVRERAGMSLEVRGVGGMDEDGSEGVGGTATREEERRRPREARVSGGRTFVEDARCLLGGGAGGQREADMARKQRRGGRRARG